MKRIAIFLALLLGVVQMSAQTIDFKGTAMGRKKIMPMIKKYAPGNILCTPRDILTLTTHKESEIHNFYLNGQAVHKEKGIGLGYLFDEELLKQQIKKNWGINPKKIQSLSVNGREIRIKTKK